jgi:hypothetical protein
MVFELPPGSSLCRMCPLVVNDENGYRKEAERNKAFGCAGPVDIDVVVMLPQIKHGSRGLVRVPLPDAGATHCGRDEENGWGPALKETTERRIVYDRYDGDGRVVRIAIGQASVLTEAYGPPPRRLSPPPPADHEVTPPPPLYAIEGGAGSMTEVHQQLTRAAAMVRGIGFVGLQEELTGRRRQLRGALHGAEDDAAVAALAAADKAAELLENCIDLMSRLDGQVHNFNGNT